MSGDARARRRWLPWRPRFRLILAYPRYWHWVVVQLGRFDIWFSRRFRGTPGWPVLLAIVFVAFVIVRFLGLVAVLEITIIAFAASVYLVWGEWMALLLLAPLVLLARLLHLRPWPLVARSGTRRWTARVTGWRASGDAAQEAVRALEAGGAPATSLWATSRTRSHFWI
jgi:hypothetical protein